MPNDKEAPEVGSAVETPRDPVMTAAEAARSAVERLAELTDAEEALLAAFDAESIEALFAGANTLETFLAMLPEYLAESAISEERLGEILIVGANFSTENAQFILDSLADPSFPSLDPAVVQSVRQACEAKLTES
ncbi:hypothetical protein IPJ72_02575 [Candidatus Peregrinibacteria bacterium]|nr:MAG: hypothetical protein IPJ72_02575 [Candidatus Peregrinibacteria bacterium]